jgi:hypothetical protein
MDLSGTRASPEISGVLLRDAAFGCSSESGS